MSEAKQPRPLNAQQRRFVDAYLALGFNATRAAAEAGYRHPDTYGSQLLRHEAVKAEISARLDELAMPANEVLARLADIARGTLADFIDVPTTDPPKPARDYRVGDRCPRCEEQRPDSVTVLERGTVTNLATGHRREALLCPLCAEGWLPVEPPDWTLNLRKAAKAGKLHLLSELKMGEYGPQLKILDPLKALELLGKHHKLFTEKHEHSGPGGKPIPLALTDLIGLDGDELDRRLQDAEAHFTAGCVPQGP